VDSDTPAPEIEGDDEVRSTTQPSRSEAWLRAPILVVPRSWILGFCLTIYALSFALPIDPTQRDSSRGIACFLESFLFGLWGCFNPIHSGEFQFHRIDGLLLIGTWAANPVFWVGAWLLHAGHGWRASLAASLSLLLGVLPALAAGGRGHFWPHCIYSCYYVWLASFASLALCGFLMGLRRVQPG
jgi:hypothetical protein